MNTSTGSPNPCLTCGACCAAFRVSFYWSESSEDIADSVPTELTYHVAPLLCAMKGTDQPYPRCIALQGEVGTGVWCAIYGRHPSVCHEVVPWDPNGVANVWCERARAIWGLPRLMPILIGEQDPK